MIQLLEEEFDAKIFTDWPSRVILANQSDPDMRHVCLLPEVFANKGYYIFALARNPYAVEVSRFNYWPQSKEWHQMQDKLQWPKDMSFSDYLRNHAQNFDSSLSNRYLSCSTGWFPEGCVPFVPSQILHLENLEREFMTLPFVDKCVDMPTRNVQTHCAEAMYTSVEDVNWVYQMRKGDFVNFGYSRKLPWKLWTAKM